MAKVIQEGRFDITLLLNSVGDENTIIRSLLSIVETVKTKNRKVTAYAGNRVHSFVTQLFFEATEKYALPHSVFVPPTSTPLSAQQLLDTKRLDKILKYPSLIADHAAETIGIEVDLGACFDPVSQFVVCCQRERAVFEESGVMVEVFSNKGALELEPLERCSDPQLLHMMFAYAMSMNVYPCLADDLDPELDTAQ